MGTKPVDFVTWADAARYTNWIHNGSPAGDQGIATTERGAYDLALGTSATRLAAARAFLPSET
jgi:hypothetical protein